MTMLVRSSYPTAGPVASDINMDDGVSDRLAFQSRPQVDNGQSIAMFPHFTRLPPGPPPGRKAPSLTPRIKIQKRPHHIRDDDDEYGIGDDEAQVQAQTIEYDMATWRMYERIVRHRNNNLTRSGQQKQQQQQDQTDDDDDDDGKPAIVIEDDSSSFHFRLPVQYHRYDYQKYGGHCGMEADDVHFDDDDHHQIDDLEPIFELEL